MLDYNVQRDCNLTQIGGNSISHPSLLSFLYIIHSNIYFALTRRTSRYERFVVMSILVVSMCLLKIEFYFFINQKRIWHRYTQGKHMAR